MKLLSLTGDATCEIISGIFLQHRGQPGAVCADLFNACKEMCYLYTRSLWSVLRSTIFWHNTINEMNFIGVNSVPLVAIISTFTGMVISLQVGQIFADFGVSSQLGNVLAVAFGRELAPVLTGVVVAGRVGSSIAAEIGSMKVTEQIDALKTLSADPIDYLVAPKLLAAFLMMPLLTIVSNILGMAGGFMVAVHQKAVTAVAFFESIASYITPWNFIGGLIKAFFFGLVVAGVGAYKGLHTENGAVGVGTATTQSVVTGTIYIFILNYFLTIILY